MSVEEDLSWTHVEEEEEDSSCDEGVQRAEGEGNESQTDEPLHGEEVEQKDDAKVPAEACEGVAPHMLASGSPPAPLPSGLLPPSEGAQSSVADCDGVNNTQQVSAPSSPKSNAGVPTARTESMPPLWLEAEGHMSDIQFAAKPSVELPAQIGRTSYNIIIAGQTETGRTTLALNLFAPLKQHAKSVTPSEDVSGLNVTDFRDAPHKFQTIIEGKLDDKKQWAVKYVVQESPPITPDGQVVAALVDYIKTQQQAFAALEANLAMKREDVHANDQRVDVVIYTLPTNKRVSSVDLSAIAQLAEYVPVVPVMCKGDCLDDDEKRTRKVAMKALMTDGSLKAYNFPKDILEAVAKRNQSTSLDGAADAACADMELHTLPFIIVTGNQVDESVHDFWFTRKYRFGTCEAYRLADSELKLLRQLLLENGFWSVKADADRRYRARVSADAAPPAPATDALPSCQLPPYEPVSAALSAHSSLQEPIAEMFSTAQGDEPAPSNAEVHDAADLVEVQVSSVHKSSSGSGMFRLSLVKKNGQDVPEVKTTLSLRIGSPEGNAINAASHNNYTDRPGVYDTITSLIEKLHAKVDYVVISKCDGGIFFAELHAVLPGSGERVTVDARPSDAINMALRAQARIFVKASVMQDYGRPVPRRGS